MSRKLRVALVGGGLGGLTAALALIRNGFEAEVFEQAHLLREVGAGIGLSPNALKVLRALGVEDEVRRRGFLFLRRRDAWNSLFNNARFFRRDLSQGISQDRHVIIG